MFVSLARCCGRGTRRRSGSGCMPTESTPVTLRTAIFVDFDNMFLGLNGMDAEAAETFATNPGRLLSWLAEGEGEDGPFRRRFLLKACYLNPETFRRYRGFFVSAGFRVVDCPSLTQRGKSAADIHLVLDVVDALAHATRFDEFIVCSADADFTPLMTRLRANDRRTVRVAAGPAAPAYQSVCDEAITPIELAEALTGGAAAAAAAPRHGAGTVAPSIEPPVVLTAEDSRRAAKAVRAALNAAKGVMPGASAALAAQRAVPTIAAARWGGQGFTDFVGRELPGLVMVKTEQGGMLVDPSKRSPENLLAGKPGDDLPAQVSRVTKVPGLSREQYGALFEALAVLSKEPPALNRIGVEPRDRIADAGLAVPRQAASFVVQGLIYAGADPREGDRDALDFATRGRDNVLVLCDRAGLEMDAKRKKQLNEWLLGGLP